MRDTLPPRKKKWKPGTWQVGLYVRMPDGSQIASVWNLAPDLVRELAMKMLLEQFPDVKKAAAEYASRPGPSPVLPDLGEDDEPR